MYKQKHNIRKKRPLHEAEGVFFSGCRKTVLRYVNHERDVFGAPAPNGAWLLVINRSGLEQPWQADAAAAGCGLLAGRIAPRSAQWHRLV